MRKVLLVAATAAAMLSSASAEAMGSAPAVISLTRTQTGIAVTFAGYDATASYTVEISRSSLTDPVTHHFVSQLNRSPALTLTAGVPGTWYLARRLAAGAYYVRVFDDYTAEWILYETGVCKVTGCAPTWDGNPLVAWSSVARVAVPASR